MMTEVYNQMRIDSRDTMNTESDWPQWLANGHLFSSLTLQLINRVHKWALRILLEDYTSSFDERS